ncbi:hypothetical protein F5Y01DRAFT_287344 [Xylaria sp. FL0043]|nr:hypothetical protein F5Y01DRAFT_287344 [Xylaria sp. FL0043]
MNHCLRLLLLLIVDSHRNFRVSYWGLYSRSRGSGSMSQCFRKQASQTTTLQLAAFTLARGVIAPPLLVDAVDERLGAGGAHAAGRFYAHDSPKELSSASGQGNRSWDGGAIGAARLLDVSANISFCPLFVWD